MKYFFLKTVIAKGRARLRALPGQFFDDGNTVVSPSVNVAASKEIRARYPIGTVYVTNSLFRRDGFYQAGTIYPIVDIYKDNADRPPHEFVEAYWAFGETADTTLSDDSNAELEPKSPPLSLLAKMQGNPELAAPTVKNDGFYVDEGQWFLLLRNILNQVNTLIVGPAGTGKTALIMLACKRLGIPCHVYDMGSMYDPIAGLLGVHRLKKGGESIFDYAKFTRDISSKGVVLLDELSRAPVTTNNILFPCLDDRRKLPVEIAGGEDLREIAVHPECSFIATANVGAEYTGTMSMDKALVNRFFPLELDYIPKEHEITVLMKRCGILKKDANLIVDVANSIRTMNRNQELSCSISTRETLMAGELVADGWTVLSALEMIFLPLFEGTRAEGERGIVAKLLIGH